MRCTGKKNAEKREIDLQLQPVSRRGAPICGAPCRAHRHERIRKSRKSARCRQTNRKASARWGGGGRSGSPFLSEAGGAICTSRFALWKPPSTPLCTHSTQKTNTEAKSSRTILRYHDLGRNWDRKFYLHFASEINPAEFTFAQGFTDFEIVKRPFPLGGLFWGRLAGHRKREIGEMKLGI